VCANGLQTALERDIRLEFERQRPRRINQTEERRVSGDCALSPRGSDHGLTARTLIGEGAGQFHEAVLQGFGRFKGRVLGLLPLFLKIDLHVVGLIHLLAIGLRLLCLAQYVVRRKLFEAEVESERQIKGLYAGQTSRATARPTTELMLDAFEGINLVIGKNEKGQTVAWIAPLKELQKRILDLLGFTQEIYIRLTIHFQNLAPG